MMMTSSGGSWLFPLMAVVMIAFVAVIAGVADAVLSSTLRPSRPEVGSRSRDGAAREGAERPLDVLRRRYVRGEIDHEEFERRVELLIRSESAPSHEQLSTRSG